MSWDMVKIGEVCTTGSGGTPARKIPEYYNGDIPWVKSGDLRENVVTTVTEYISDIAIQKSSAKIVSEGAILLAMYGATVGRMAILGIDAATNQAVCNIVPDEKRAFSKYVYYALRNKVPEFLRNAVGGAQPNINQGMIKDTKIPLPPLPEQKRIATLLDKADAIRRKRQQAIDLADEFLRSVFLDMFGDPVTNPKGWEVCACADICRQITVGLVIRPASYYVEKGVPAIRSLNIGKKGIKQSNFVYFSHLDNETVLSKSRVYEGDLVVVRSGQPGKAAVIPKDLNGINAIDVLIIRPKSEIISPDFLAFFLNSSAGKKLVMSEERGQIQKHLNVGSLNLAMIPVPPIEIQNKFVDIMYKVRNMSGDNKLTECNSFFNALSQQAFAGKL